MSLKVIDSLIKTFFLAVLYLGEWKAVGILAPVGTQFPADPHPLCTIRKVNKAMQLGQK
jgi:hypothetical protein